MKPKVELDCTTNNSVYRKLKIKFTSCGWCGLGKGCNLRYRRKRYYYDVATCKQCRENRFRIPNWKLTSKCKKQYQKKKLKYTQHKRDLNYYDISW